MAIRDDIKTQVQQATDLVRLIGEQVALRPKGREFVGLCPFHDDKNPSMSVSPAKQIYKCFSCGAGGDVFSFVMNYHKMTFPEALRHLAEQAGIEVEETPRGQGGEGPSDRQRIADANQKALDFFRVMLRHGEHGRSARDYIEKRGISPEMVAEFQLGYAPDRWDGLVQTIGGKRWDLDAFLKAELVLPRKTGDGCFDFLRHRLVFPIFDSLGRPIAFGGRKLREEDEPKYLNSRETAVFNKSRTLYGLHLAKKAIIASRTAIIVEGYTDVIACHQAEQRNVVATLGTALTAEHVAELRRYAERVVLIFDADAAGEKAADRAVELFLTGDLDVVIAELPEGPDGGKMDPAELMQAEGGLESWARCMAEATDALEYQFRRVVERLGGAETVTGRQKVAEEYLARVGQLGIARTGAIRRSLVIQRLAGLLHLSEPQVDDLLKQATPRGPVHAAAPGHAGPPGGGISAGAVEMRGADGENNESADVARSESGSRLKAGELAERELIGCLIRDGGLFVAPLSNGLAIDEAIAPDELLGEGNRRLYAKVYDRLSEAHELTLAELLSDFAASGEQDLADLATSAEAQVERALATPDVTVETVFRAAAERWLAMRRERQFQASKGEWVGLAREAGGDAEVGARALDQAREHLSGTQSPVRILRVRG